MKCPVCDVPLSISSREGVEIDFCPQCRGVWLDRGELDKIIDRVATAPTAAVGSSPSSERWERDRDDDRYRGDDRSRRDDDRYDPRDKRRKKRSFLDDIFDFD